jgi:DNA mismatch repair protein MutL
MPIRRLPPLLVNQIAAGEVIERPASVVKEVVENAIDAGASRIDIAIEQGGCELIRVADNGCGIAPEELPLAIAPHATSKIASAGDLDAIATMGFRGEALASIASVSRLSVLSRAAGQAGGTVIEIEGDQAQSPRPGPASPGTVVTVRNLFFNTPARRKFLKTEQTEASRVQDVVEAIAMAHPSIAFVLRSDERAKIDLPAGQSPRERLLAVLGPDLAPELLEVDADDHGLSIWGLAGKPGIARGTTKHQRLYLNGRPIIDRSLNHAIKEAYRGLIDPTRSPTIVLFLTMHPAQVDVNVHPAKAEVRFRNQAMVHGAVLSAIRRTLRAADLVPALQVSDPLSRSWTTSAGLGESLQPAVAGATSEFGTGMAAASAGAPPARAFVDFFRRLDPAQRGFVYSEVKQALAADNPEILSAEVARPDASATQRTTVDTQVLPIVRPVADVLQVHSSYIVTQDEQGLVIIDQHALHERVIFEQLKSRVQGVAGTNASVNLESQRLLMPAIVDVDRSQVNLLDELRPLLTRIGIEAEQISPTAIALHSFTSLLFERGVDPVEFMTELLDRAANRGVNTDEEAALHEVLDMMACKAAVKAGDRLQPAELAELLRQRERVERSSSCPHGRPTSLRVSLKELEKQFGRT